MREERKSVIYDFIFASDQIKFLERNLPKGFFTRIKTKYNIKKMRKDLINKIESTDNIIFDKELLLQFIQIYNGYKDHISLPEFTTAINEENKHHIINIKTDIYKVYIVAINDPNDRYIYITIDNIEANVLKKFNVYDRLNTENSFREHDAVNVVNSILVEELQIYLIKYIMGGE